MRCSISMLSSIWPKWAPSQSTKWAWDKGKSFHTLSNSVKKHLHCPKMHRRIDWQLILMWICLNPVLSNLGKYYYFSFSCICVCSLSLGSCQSESSPSILTQKASVITSRKCNPAEQKEEQLGEDMTWFVPWVSRFFVIIAKHQIQGAYEGKKDLFI